MRLNDFDHGDYYFSDKKCPVNVVTPYYKSHELPANYTVSILHLLAPVCTLWNIKKLCIYRFLCRNMVISRIVFAHLVFKLRVFFGDRNSEDLPVRIVKIMGASLFIEDLKRSYETRLSNPWKFVQMWPWWRQAECASPAQKVAKLRPPGALNSRKKAMHRLYFCEMELNWFVLAHVMSLVLLMRSHVFQVEDEWALSRLYTSLFSLELVFNFPFGTSLLAVRSNFSALLMKVNWDRLTES